MGKGRPHLRSCAGEARKECPWVSLQANGFASERVFFEEFQKLFKRLKKYYIFPGVYRDANARGCLVRMYVRARKGIL